MEVSKAPVIASHSSVRALRDHPRNMSDDMIRALAKNGGVIQINFYAYFIDQDFGDRVDAAFAATNDDLTAIASRNMDDLVAYDDAEWAYDRKIQGGIEWPPLSVVIDHIDHVVRLVGPEHVGLGSDFDGVNSLPVDLEHQGKMPNITRALVEKGYSEADIKLILGENLLRVMAAVEDTAQALARK